MELKILIFAFLISPAKISYCQKKTLTNDSIKEWPVIGEKSLSNNGRLVAYGVSSPKGDSRLIIEATDHSWKKEILGGKGAMISEDCKRVIFKNANAVVFIWDVESQTTDSITDCSYYKFSTTLNADWLAFSSPGVNGKTFVRNLRTHTQIELSHSENMLFSKNGTALILETKKIKDSDLNHYLFWVTLSTGRIDTIFSGRTALDHITFDEAGMQLIFYTDEILRGNSQTVLKYFKYGMDKALTLVANISKGLKSWSVSKDYCTLGALPRFSQNGQRVFFSVKNIALNKARANSVPGVQLDVWNYKDGFLQSEQLKTNIGRPDDRALAAVVNLNFEKKVVILENDSNDLRNQVKLALADEGNQDLALLTSTEFNGNPNENYWHITINSVYYLVSLNDGFRKKLNINFNSDMRSPTFSRSGRYIFWFDYKAGQYFCYNIKKDIVSEISQNIPELLYYKSDYLTHEYDPFGFGAIFSQNDDYVLVNSKYDVWLIDLRHLDKPRNLSNGYGKLSKITLRVQSQLNIKFDSTCDNILFSAFNTVTKESGYYISRSQNKNSIEKLYMGPCEFRSMKKAKSVDVYILEISGTKQYPNLFLTSDFKSFSSLTNFQPQDSFNWFSTELIQWTTFNGLSSEGILYKPENFDPQRKYPIIFTYYEFYSDYLFRYLSPIPSEGELNIPWYVSNGYLVFVPDIHYKLGYPGKSAYNSVVSAAVYLSKKPWVNKEKMGLQGHSFGGYETNYIVTRSKLFKAAAPLAGPSDLGAFAYSLNLNSNYESYDHMTENGQIRIGTTIAENPAIYISNSPIFYIKNIQTPILILHNKNDLNVTWSQGIEWFLSLRRARKKVWMLQYDDEGHTIDKYENKLDFTLRLEQFFDHYLKDIPPPKWMTDGVPAYEKGFDSGLELDYSGKKP